MFTGIIQAVGTVLRQDGPRLEIRWPASPDTPFEIGESIAVNGCCLTVVEGADTDVVFDLSEETRRLTTLDRLSTNTRVNLERALRVGDRLGGHWVLGHVDGIGQILDIEVHADSHRFRFEFPSVFADLLVPKGSISVDGVSLTVVEPTDAEFSVWVIPHTLAVTTLGDRRPGDHVNLEFDPYAKHVVQLATRMFGRWREEFGRNLD